MFSFIVIHSVDSTRPGAYNTFNNKQGFSFQFAFTYTNANKPAEAQDILYRIQCKTESVGWRIISQKGVILTNIFYLNPNFFEIWINFSFFLREKLKNCKENFDEWIMFCCAVLSCDLYFCMSECDDCLWLMCSAVLWQSVLNSFK